MKMSLKKKVISLALSACLAVPFAAVSQTAFAAETDNLVKVNFKKVDGNTDEAIGGARIAVYKYDDINNKRLDKILEADTDKDGKLDKSTASTEKYFNEDGELQLSEKGSFIFIETKAPENYNINQKGEVASFLNEGENVTLKNYKKDNQKAYVIVNTYNKDNNQKYKKLTLKLYKVNNANETVPQDKDLIFKAETDISDGKIDENSLNLGESLYQNGDLVLEPGNYILEVKDGDNTIKTYKLNAKKGESLEMTLLSPAISGNSNQSGNNSGNNSSSGTVNNTNRNVTGLQMTVLDKNSKKPVKGATFEVYNSNKKRVFKGSTDKNGHFSKSDAISGKDLVDANGGIALEPGTYYFKQVSAPKGYTADSKSHTFTVKKGETFKAIVYNTPNNGKSSKLAKTGFDTPGSELVIAGLLIIVAGLTMFKRQRD